MQFWFSPGHFNRRNLTMTKIRTNLGAALAIGIASVLAGGTARADINDSDATWSSHFDLGVDVSGVIRNAAGVRDFLSHYAPETQNAIMGSCETYMLHPNTAQSRDTLPFCSVAVGVPIGGGATGSRIVN